ncbi:MAG: hypothetical protein JO032_16465 [Alphaproteobacteria bacterium]|nr:hypothetical protein [Alphaproteobacteria bacterium]
MLPPTQPTRLFLTPAPHGDETGGGDGLSGNIGSREQGSDSMQIELGGMRAITEKRGAFRQK